MSAPSNQQLYEQIKEVDGRSERRHRSVMASLARFKLEVRDQLQPFRDYLVGQDAISKANSKNNTSIPPEVWWLIKALVLIIAATVGAKIAL